MLILSSEFNKCFIKSNQTNNKVGRIKSAVINKDKLSIVAWYINSKDSVSKKQILLSEDIKELKRNKILIESVNKLKNLDEVAKLNNLIKENYQLKKSIVFDNNGQKLGQVIDYLIDTDTFIIEQIIIRSSSVLKSLSPELIIGRKQIISVEPKRIIVKSTGIKRFNFKKVQNFLLQSQPKTVTSSSSSACQNKS